MCGGSIGHRFEVLDMNFLLVWPMCIWRGAVRLNLKELKVPFGVQICRQVARLSVQCDFHIVWLRVMGEYLYPNDAV
jgi:hypothetical protein